MGGARRGRRQDLHLRVVIAVSRPGAAAERRPSTRHQPSEPSRKISVDGRTGHVASHHRPPNSPPVARQRCPRPAGAPDHRAPRFSAFCYRPVSPFFVYADSALDKPGTTGSALQSPPCGWSALCRSCYCSLSRSALVGSAATCWADGEWPESRSQPRVGLGLRTS
jgi:hypothetical protein